MTSVAGHITPIQITMRRSETLVQGSVEFFHSERYGNVGGGVCGKEVEVTGDLKVGDVG